ncbi:MAG: hypothetical protein ACK4NY_15190 [Spirosomataceae bacterium]
MKKTLVFILIITAIQSHACDMCGCANSGSFFGILPQSHLRFVGVRYRTRDFDSHLNSQILKTKEHFQTTELWGRFYPFKKTQLLVFLPYNFNKQTTLSGRTAKLEGLGDASMIMHYNVFNTFWDSTVHHINQNFLIGGGIKLPTGRYKFEETGEEGANANFQLGTGSVDFVLNAIYTLRYHNWGLNFDASHKINTANSSRYRFANRTNGSLTAFYTAKLGDLTVMPNLGTMVEYSKKDTKNGIENDFTGGWVMMANAGIELYYKRFSTGLTFQKPIVQNLVNRESKINQQASVNFTLMF